MKGSSDLEVKHETVVARFEEYYKLNRLLFSSVDSALSPLFHKYGSNYLSCNAPRKLLLSNAGHLGDAIITTGLLPVLHAIFPGIEIGFLCGSWASPIVDNHPLISRIHLLDHWYLQRNTVPRWKRFINYSFIDKKRIISEIRDQSYDVTIDVRSWFPNFITILWQADIPVRIGYNRVGFGPLLTHSFNYRYNRRHELEYQFDLLIALGVDPSALALAKPCLPPVSAASTNEAQSIVSSLTRYRVLHVASSTPSRDWPIANWQTLAHNLIARNIIPVLTGKGQRDLMLTSQIAKAVPNCIVACDHLSWGGLVALIAGAEMVYSVETSVGHVAAALGKPVVSIYGGMADSMHWKPYGNTAIVATNNLSCSPCFIKQGCRTRECLTQLNVDVVTATANKLIS